ncbi:MAG: BrnA antitoxin family protein [Thiolinea sp.]
MHESNTFLQNKSKIDKQRDSHQVVVPPLPRKQPSDCYRLNPEVLQWFRDQVKGGGNYQSLINEALKAHIKQEGQSLETILRRVIREEIEAERKQVAA